VLSAHAHILQVISNVVLHHTLDYVALYIPIYLVVMVLKCHLLSKFLHPLQNIIKLFKLLFLMTHSFIVLGFFLLIKFIVPGYQKNFLA
jgi:hypothetical protein